MRGAWMWVWLCLGVVGVLSIQSHKFESIGPGSCGEPYHTLLVQSTLTCAITCTQGEGMCAGFSVTKVPVYIEDPPQRFSLTCQLFQILTTPDNNQSSICYRLVIPNGSTYTTTTTTPSFNTTTTTTTPTTTTSSTLELDITIERYSLEAVPSTGDFLCSPLGYCVVSEMNSSTGGIVNNVKILVTTPTSPLTTDSVTLAEFNIINTDSCPDYHIVVGMKYESSWHKLQCAPMVPDLAISYQNWFQCYNGIPSGHAPDHYLACHAGSFVTATDWLSGSYSSNNYRTGVRCCPLPNVNTSYLPFWV
ncbi:hypothetical protein Pcinc_035672 [Petrolisthes cinctipes]|uniref:Uncharacterized protein n=1 Tax=Petrolisthes cinctipes TaxID=88211 RepID=A0AAE1C0D8_PETCI|nr:hypothetical protein Pcinc_035672 [Petrolisthes cinctipes]